MHMGVVNLCPSQTSVREAIKSTVSHHPSPYWCPGCAQRGVLAENGVHAPADRAEPRAGHLEDPEDQHALLVEHEVPVSVHLRC